MGKNNWPPPGRTRGHQRGELLAAYGENFVAIDTHGLLDDLDSVLADVETRADSLLEALVDFLESETARVPADTVE